MVSDRQAEIISGLCAGSATTLVMHPLDLIKVRLQLSSEKPKYPFSSLVNVIKSINASALQDFKTNRIKTTSKNANSTHLAFILKHYYRGLGANLFGNVLAWSVYFTLYADFKNVVQTSSPTLNYFSSSAFAGITTSLLTNPIWVLKTRILGTNKNEANAYTSIIDGVNKIWKNEGLISFWRGTVPGLFSVFQASLQFMFYDHLKNYMTDKSGTNTRLSTIEYLIASASTKAASMIIMYPTQVIKSRMQIATSKRKSAIEVIKDIWSHEGRFNGFYKGMCANLVRSIPATCITFVVYEKARDSMRS